MLTGRAAAEILPGDDDANCGKLVIVEGQEKVEDTTKLTLAAVEA